MMQMGHILQEEAIHLHQVETRQRITVLAEVLRDNVHVLIEISNDAQRWRNLSALGRVMDKILPETLLEELLLHYENAH